MKKAVFLDRDGTVNEDLGHVYSPDKLIFIPRALDALRLLQEIFSLFIITNQSGISKGIFNEEECSLFNNHFEGVLEANGITVKQIYCCPHVKEDQCLCHKPKPFFLKRAQREFGVNLKNSYVVGDHPHDVETAFAVNAKGVYLLSGHGRKHRNELVVVPHYIARDLYEAAQWIIKDEERKSPSTIGSSEGCQR